jgi:hypothetical protein
MGMGGARCFCDDEGEGEVEDEDDSLLSSLSDGSGTRGSRDGPGTLGPLASGAGGTYLKRKKGK